MCSWRARICMSVFFFTASATTEIYTLSLHDALPIFSSVVNRRLRSQAVAFRWLPMLWSIGLPHSGQLLDCGNPLSVRSEEHTSELQSRENLVCRLLLEKKKTTQSTTIENAYHHTRCI